MTDLGQMIAAIPASDRGWDSVVPTPWLCPNDPGDMAPIDVVQALMRNVCEISGFTAASLQAGDLVETESDVLALERACREIANTLEPLRRALACLRRGVTTDEGK